MDVKRNWTNEYAGRVERNIGIVSYEEQEKIRKSTVAIMGVGGLGAPLAINLALIGCESFIVVDFDVVERSNLNRLPYSTDKIGQRKIDVLEEQLKGINEKINIKKYLTVSEANIDEVLQNVTIVALTLDGPVASILIARKARELHIPLVETWAIPYIFAWWFTTDSMDYESCYGLTTQKLSVDVMENNPEISKGIRQKQIEQLLKLPDIKKYYSREEGFYELLTQGKIGLRSLAPFVWLNSTYVASEIIFSGILEIKQKTVAPEMKGFNVLTLEPLHV